MNLWIGLSALRASQFGINSVSNNVANASTAGYHRQEVGLQTRQSHLDQGHYIGSGVEISDVRRMRDQIVESSYTNSIADLNAIGQQLLIESRVESFFLNGDGTVQHALTGMFDELARLSANPNEATLRNSVVNQAGNLTQRIRQLSSEFVELKDSVSRQLNLEVDALNLEIEELVDLQNRIKASRVHDVPNDLLDQRDRLINRIAERIDVQRYESVQEKLGLGIAGSSISLGTVAIRFETVVSDNGSIGIHLEGSDRETTFASGKIAALTELHNNFIDQYTNKIDQFASALIREVDQAHAVGVGIDGPFSVLYGSRAVNDVNADLNSSGIAFPVSAGEIFVSVTSPTQVRRITSINIDPAIDSLNDIATKLSSIDDIQAVVDEQTGKLSIIAAPGYRFDFAGNTESTPDTSNMSGTSVPWIGGLYQGETNGKLTIRAVGSGEIGITDGLNAHVIDANGNVIKEINIGNGYEPGSEIDLGDGVKFGLKAGGIVDGDSFEAILVSNSDSTGLLSALGLNNFFEGTGATDIAVAERIVADPDQIATSKTGEVGDTQNLEGLISLRNEHVLRDNRLTFEDFLIETSAEIGFRVQSSTSIHVNITELNFQYQTELDSTSGVDINEELLYLTQYQKSYEAAVQVLRTMESMLDELFQIIR